jgi:hypothetical protein
MLQNDGDAKSEEVRETKEAHGHAEDEVKRLQVVIAYLASVSFCNDVMAAWRRLTSSSAWSRASLASWLLALS